MIKDCCDKPSLGTKIISDVLNVDDIDKILLSVGQLMEKRFKLLFGDKYCWIFDSTKHEMLRVKMRGKNVSFYLKEDECKPKFVDNQELQLGDVDQAFY